jgi:TRAP-type C4-dicarboxylate transport system substrate-binding protein
MSTSVMSTGRRSLTSANSLSLLAVVSLCLTLAACQSASQPSSPTASPGASTTAAAASPSPLAWRMNINAAPADIKAQAAVEFADLLKQRTNGRITIQTYPGSTLMSATDAAKETVTGTLSIDANTGFNYEPIVSFLQLWSLPFYGLDMTDVRQIILPGSQGREIVDKALAASNLKLVAVWEAGRLGFVTYQPLNTVASLRGQQVRVSGSVLTECIRTVGGAPISMTGSEAVDAMRRKIVVGSLMEPTGIKTRGYDEFAKYWVDWRASPNSVGIFMNLKVWQGLSTDLQQIISEVGQDVEKRADATALDAQKQALDALKQGGMTIVDVAPEEREKLRAACKAPIDKAIAAATPADLVHEFVNLMQAEATRLGR